MKYLGILLALALVLVGSIAMAEGVRFALEGDAWTYPGNSWPATIEFKVTVARYYTVTIPNPILHWYVDDPTQSGAYESDQPGTMEITSNYDITFQFSGFKDPVHKDDPNCSIEGWWRFLKDGTEVQNWFRAQGAQAFNVTIPGDGVPHVISFYTKIVVPQDHFLKAGEYSDSDILLTFSPTA